ncbi:hypothetical protein I4U23_008171 [Adineta vaga]|nr:hypothetical protein I4U23_008171 [Adineta vaga]
MLTLRRVSTVYQYLYPFSSYQYRLQSRKSGNDDDQFILTHSKEEKSINTSKNTFKNKRSYANDNRIEKKQSIPNESLSNNNEKNPAEDYRNLNIKNANQRKKFVEQRNRSPSNDKMNLAKPFNITEKKQKREGQQKKLHPQVILDTESSEVKNLTRQVADSLTPSNTPIESSNIEQELLDVLRGHRIVSKNTRRMEKMSEQPSEKEYSEQKQYHNQERSSTRRQARVTPDSKIENTTEAFSSLLRDIKLNPTRPTSRSALEDDFIRDAIDGSKVQPRFNDNREQRRDSSDSRRPMRDNRRRQEFMRPYQLWSGEPLGIFNSKEPFSKLSALWDKYEKEELLRVSSIPPRNAFEEMIQWTKDGILWKFPVDNEQDIGSEGDVPFYEHVLLERHLHDFPASPLIRQFMELVCIGLGRNPYWTAEQKLEHINWFRTFFNEKMHILNETVHTGALKTSTSPSTSKPVSTFKPKPAPPPPPPKVVPIVTPPPAVKTSTASKK